ncbi:alpha/beta-hydrolase [Byssothecium circinans]|uniref:Alpha/beta-hydrolase n=1 Tax=Byssothecium circinans TaxID=147558 RepID=A0A6A5UCQ9_9PLEO|nr:alpha/beta-hydrolase [Byssothecium circinans]
MSYPPTHFVNPADNVEHTHTIILLHGRSSTAEEFATDLFALQSSEASGSLRSHFPAVRWVFPDAGLRWCTAFKENRSAWFDTFSLDRMNNRQDLQVSGLRDGIQLVQTIVEKEVVMLNGRADKVVLGGFSQGSAVALWSIFTGAVMTKGCLGGFLGLSAWMPFTTEAKEAVNHPEKSTDRRFQDLRNAFSDILGVESFGFVEMIEKYSGFPASLGHGTDDTVVSVKNTHDVSQVFSAIGASVEVGEYVGADREGHWIKPPEQVDHIIRFLECVLKTGKERRIMHEGIQSPEPRA